MGRNLFTSEYPEYPDSQRLAVNPNLPVKEKFYSTDDNSSMTDDEDDSDSNNNNNNSTDESYV